MFGSRLHGERPSRLLDAVERRARAWLSELSPAPTATGECKDKLTIEGQSATPLARLSFHWRIWCVRIALIVCQTLGSSIWSRSAKPCLDGTGEEVEQSNCADRCRHLSTKVMTGYPVITSRQSKRVFVVHCSSFGRNSSLWSRKYARALPVVSSTRHALFRGARRNALGRHLPLSLRPRESASSPPAFPSLWLRAWDCASSCPFP